MEALINYWDWLKITRTNPRPLPGDKVSLMSGKNFNKLYEGVVKEILLDNTNPKNIIVKVGITKRKVIDCFVKINYPLLKWTEEYYKIFGKLGNILIYTIEKVGKEYWLYNHTELIDHDIDLSILKKRAEIYLKL